MEHGVNCPNRSRSFLWRAPWDICLSLPAFGPELMPGSRFWNSWRNSTVDSPGECRLSQHGPQAQRLAPNSDSRCRQSLPKANQPVLAQLLSAAEVRAADTLAVTISQSLPFL